MKKQQRLDRLYTHFSIEFVKKMKCFSINIFGFFWFRPIVAKLYDIASLKKEGRVLVMCPEKKIVAWDFSCPNVWMVWNFGTCGSRFFNATCTYVVLT